MTMQPHTFLGTPLKERHAALHWFFESAMLWIALALYCEICVLIHGGAETGLLGSGVWALQAGAGWIVIGAAFGAFGARVAESTLARQRPYWVIGLTIAACTVFALACEAYIVAVREGADSLAALLYARAPVAALASTVLTVVWVVKHGRTSPASLSKEAAPPTSSETAKEQVGYGATDIIDVMTGTGRTTIRMHDIECFRADRNYISVQHASGRTYLLRQTMASLERSLDPEVFERVHRSTIVNRRMIVERRPQGQLLLRSGATVQLSRSARKRAPNGVRPL